MHVLKAQLTDVRWAHAISRGKQQYGEIPSTDRAGTIDCGEETCDLVVTEHIADAGLAEMTSGDHGGAQVER